MRTHAVCPYKFYSICYPYKAVFDSNISMLLVANHKFCECMSKIVMYCLISIKQYDLREILRDSSTKVLRSFFKSDPFYF